MRSVWMRTHLVLSMLAAPGRRASMSRFTASRIRAGSEPHGGVVSIGVARVAQVLVALDQHRALLARVVAPHAGDGEARAPAPERNLDHRAGPPA